MLNLPPCAFPHIIQIKDGAYDPFKDRVLTGENQEYIDIGMHLRDYFAATALQGWLASFGHGQFLPKGNDLEQMADALYSVADAMIKARNPK